jgi:hypothetical protein
MDLGAFLWDVAQLVLGAIVIAGMLMAWPWVARHDRVWRAIERGGKRKRGR